MFIDRFLKQSFRSNFYECSVSDSHLSQSSHAVGSSEHKTRRDEGSATTVRAIEKNADDVWKRIGRSHNSIHDPVTSDAATTDAT